MQKKEQARDQSISINTIQTLELSKMTLNANYEFQKNVIF
jgi:hypothetical protein